MIPRAIDTGGNRVNTIALTMVVFTTAATRDRDPLLDVTLSYLYADLPRIGGGGTTMRPVSGVWGRKRASDWLKRFCCSSVACT